MTPIPNTVSGKVGIGSRSTNRVSYRQVDYTRGIRWGCVCVSVHVCVCVCAKNFFYRTNKTRDTKFSEFIVKMKTMGERGVKDMYSGPTT